MKRTTQVLGIAILFFASPITSMADDYSRPGFYVSVGGAYTQNSLIEDQVEDAVPGLDIDVDDSWAISAAVGYRVLSGLAAEVQYEFVDGFDISAAGTTVLESSAHTVTANLKLIAPLWRVQPYLLLGAGMTRWDFDDKLGIGLKNGDTAFAGRVGGGLDFYLTQNVVLFANSNIVLTDGSADVDFPGGDDIDYLFYITAGAGLQYRF